jgi:isopentenyl-diphosphate delta-isomerase
VATGGVFSGIDAAKALVLGAHLVGIARPVLQAYERGGVSEVHRFLDQVELELRSVMLLVGAANLGQLRRVPRLLRGQLREWNSLWQEADGIEEPTHAGR